MHAKNIQNMQDILLVAKQYQFHALQRLRHSEKQGCVFSHINENGTFIIYCILISILCSACLLYVKVNVQQVI